MDLQSFLLAVSFSAIPLVFAITVHEVAHGWVARRFGDRTAEAAGRLTLNPISHIDPIGTIVVPALLYWSSNGSVLFGWAKPVPVNPRYLRHPRADMVKVALAGPGANLLMAVFWAAVLVAVSAVGTTLAAADWVAAMARVGVFANILLAAFNLLPVPPLDGGRVLANGLPPSAFTRVLDRLEPWGMLIIVVLLVTGIAGAFVVPLAGLLSRLVYSLVGL